MKLPFSLRTKLFVDRIHAYYLMGITGNLSLPSAAVPRGESRLNGLSEARSPSYTWSEPRKYCILTEHFGQYQRGVIDSEIIRVLSCD